MILHIDMDAFYASVEQRDRPELRGKPVIVGGTAEGRGVVCAASYEARKFGVHSAMSAARAVRLCPQGVFLSPRMDVYAEISGQIREIFERYTPLIEPLSLDEAFLDVTGSERLFGPSVEIGRAIKEAIRNELRLVASVGVAPSKFVAKIASDLEKPDGFVVVPDGTQQTFLDPLPIGRIWGVGQSTEKKLHRHGIRTVRDLRKLAQPLLGELFGEVGEHFWRLARGIDPRRVVPDRRAKSISHETTFAHDIEDLEILHARVLELADNVARRARRYRLFGNTVQLKLRYSDFRTISRSKRLTNPSNVTNEIYDVAAEVVTKALQGRDFRIRLIGVGLSQLNRAAQRQLMLFDEEQHQAQQKIDTATDKIRDKFGHGSLKRGTVVRRRPRGEQP